MNTNDKKQLKIFNKILSKEQRKNQRHCVIEFLKTSLINKYNANIDLKGNEVSSISLNFPLWWCKKHYNLVRSANPDFDESEVRAFSILYDATLTW